MIKWHYGYFVIFFNISWKIIFSTLFFRQIVHCQTRLKQLIHVHKQLLNGKKQPLEKTVKLPHITVLRWITTVWLMRGWTKRLKYAHPKSLSPVMFILIKIQFFFIYIIHQTQSNKSNAIQWMFSVGTVCAEFNFGGNRIQRNENAACQNCPKAYYSNVAFKCKYNFIFYLQY